MSPIPDIVELCSVTIQELYFMKDLVYPSMNSIGTVFVGPPEFGLGFWWAGGEEPCTYTRLKCFPGSCYRYDCGYLHIEDRDAGVPIFTRNGIMVAAKL